jgi:hypothetical protein
MADSCACADVLQGSELFVLDNLRSCLTGYDLGESACWEFNYQSAFARLGSSAANRLVPELHLWALVLRQNAGRGLSYFPKFCRHVCRDEFLALAALSFAQNDDEETANLALQNLQVTQHSATREILWRQTERRAGHFAAAGIMLRPLPVESVILAGRFGQGASSPSQLLN